MAGQTIQQTIKIDLTGHEQLTGDARAEYDALNASLKGVSLTSETAINSLTRMGEIVANMKDPTIALNAATQQLDSNLKSVAGSAGIAANATGGLNEGLKGVNSTLNGGFLDTISKQRIAFQDVGRAITGQGFSLRTLSSNFSLLGPEATIAAAAVGFIGEELFKYITTGTDAAKATKAFNDTLTEAGKTASTAGEEVTKVKEAFKLAEDGVISKTQAVEIYNISIGKTTGQVKTLEQAEEALQKNADAFITMTLQKAIAETAGQKAAQAQIDLLILQQTQGKQLADAVAYNNETKEDSDEHYLESVKATQKQQRDEAQQQVDLFTNIAKNGYAQMEAISKQFKFNPLGADTKDQKKTDEALKELQDYIAKSQEINQTAQQKEIDQENIKYDKLLSDLKKAHVDSETATEQHEQNISDIKLKYEAKADEIFAIAQAKHAGRQTDIEADNIKVLDELDKAETEYLSKGERLDDDARGKKIDAENAEYIKLFNQAQEANQSTEQLEAAHRQHLADIDAEFDAKDQEKRDKQLQAGQKQVNSIIGQNVSQYANQKTQLDNYQKALDNSFAHNDITQQQYTDDVNKLAQARAQIQLKEISNYSSYASDIGNSLTTIAQALGENTEAGKDVAIAGALISTISGAVKAYDSLASIPFVGPELGIAAAAAALASGYENVKKIEAVRIPGQGGGSTTAIDTSGGAVASYSAPQVGQAVNSTNLSAQSIQQISQLNQNQQPIKAYVVESEVQESINRTTGYVNSATLGGQRH